MGEDDLMFDRGTVKVEARRVTAFCQQRVVVAGSDDRLAWRYLRCRDPVLDLGHDVIDAVDVSHWRRVER